MKKNLGLFFLTLLIISTVFSGYNHPSNEKSLEKITTPPTEINVSAASSLAGALTEIQGEYLKEHGVMPVFNFGASGMLEKQISQGAPCDLFISASQEDMDSLEDNHFLREGSRTELLSNSLTLISSQEMANELTGFEFIINQEAYSLAIGEPESAPIGAYARQSLQSEGLWESAQGKIIYAKDAKQILEYVDSGNVDYGIVYKTDARLLKSGRVVAELPASSHEPIEYPMALIFDTINQEKARDFYEFLQNDYSRSVFEKFGFQVL